jgi:subtilisin family serine protease
MQKNLKIIGVALVVGTLLGACTQLSAPQVKRYPYTMTVDIHSTDTPSSIERQYDAPVVLFDAEAGYAVLGLETNQTSRSTTNTPIEDNLGVVFADSSLGIWADGSLGIWADGSLGIWADGSLGIWAEASLGIWAEGRYAPIPANTANWTSIDLQKGQARATNLGKNVTIAVIDSGLDLNHPAFGRSLVASNQMRDFVDGDNTPHDATYGHGTAVAAVALQIAPAAKILPLRVLDNNGTGDADKLAQAIQYAVSSKVNIINISLSVAGTSEPVRRALQAASNAKIPVLLSAGNQGGRLGFPAVLAVGPLGIVSVGSLDATGVKSVFSNYGANLELSAPGEGIVTAYPNNQSIVASGTSMATAVVSGAVALALGERSFSDPNTVARQTWTTASGSIYRLPGNSAFAYIQPDSQGYLGTLGYKGRLNLENYLKTALK